MNALQRYVRFWDQREGAEALAAVRIGVGLVLLADLAQVFQLGLVGALWGPIEEGGIGPSSYAAPLSAAYAWFGASTHTAYLLFGLTVLVAVTLCVGLYTRSSAAVLLICMAQLSALAPDADRGIDTLLRNVLAVLALSGAGETWSIDAYRRHGHFAPRAVVYAWPRYLLIAQLVILYFWAGMLKQGAVWTSLGDYIALFRVLSKPHYARFELPHAWLVSGYLLLQIGTIATLVFERTAILLPWALWLRKHPERGGLLSRIVRRGRLVEIWALTGVFFHVGLSLTTKLGIFPWGCLAIYPALIRPAVLARWFSRKTSLSTNVAWSTHTRSAARDPVRERRS